jgi:hypothetical protein
VLLQPHPQTLIVRIVEYTVERTKEMKTVYFWVLLTILVADVLVVTLGIEQICAEPEADLTSTSDDHRLGFTATDIDDPVDEARVAEPFNITISRVGHDEDFSFEVWVADITRMRGLFFNLTWEGRYQVYDGGPGPWFFNGSTYYRYMPLFSFERLTLNSEVFPVGFRKVLISDHRDVDPVTGFGWVALSIDMRMIDPSYPLINGTFKVCDITFMVEDPWFDGRQPSYFLEDSHSFAAEFARTYFVFCEGWFSVVCGGVQYIYFGTLYGDAGYWNGTDWIGYVGKALYYFLSEPYYSMRSIGRYTFAPIPGDLDLSGEVDIKDVMIISSYYGKLATDYPNMYYDLDGNGVIDVFDIVVVTKNFGRTEP